MSGCCFALRDLSSNGELQSVMAQPDLDLSGLITLYVFVLPRYARVAHFSACSRGG